MAEPLAKKKTANRFQQRTAFSCAQDPFLISTFWNYLVTLVLVDKQNEMLFFCSTRIPHLPLPLPWRRPLGLQEALVEALLRDELIQSPSAIVFVLLCLRVQVRVGTCMCLFLRVCVCVCVCLCVPALTGHFHWVPYVDTTAGHPHLFLSPSTFSKFRMANFGV